MFESLSDKLQGVFKKIRGHGKLSEKNMEEALAEVKMALLEADVNFKVVRAFVKSVKEKAVGQEVYSSLTPGQMVIKIVHDELVRIMGETIVPVQKSSSGITKIMLVGLQGSGKTTTCGKLALHFKKQGAKPLLVAGDIYRPAAIKQLQVVGEQIGVPVFTMGTSDVDLIVKNAMKKAEEELNDFLIVDTAGRLHIDDVLMDELDRVKKVLKPDEILLVADMMTGQDAVNVAGEFDSKLDVSGVILTKVDGDARGGAALSIREVTGKPIKFLGAGEKLENLEPFHPDRLASRILGMGDVLSLIEKAEATMDAEKASELEKKLRAQKFDFNDFLDQLRQIKKMGPLEDILSMLPGFSQVKKSADIQMGEKELGKVEAIICSMTPKERTNPAILDTSRKKRIASGSGVSLDNVNKLIKQFKETQKMMKNFGAIEKQMRKMGNLGNLFGL